MIEVKILAEPIIKVNVLGEVVIGRYYPPYIGGYEVTPTNQTQTLLTEGKALSQNVVVNPIPNNYGLITYSGFELTVS